MKKIFLLTFFLIFFVNCGDDSHVHFDDVPALKSGITFVPFTYSGTSYGSFSGYREIEILQGESGRFSANIQINGNRIAYDYISDYVKNFIWNFGKESANTSAIAKTFPDTGIFPIILKTVDYFDDTLRDTLTLYVTNPLHVTPQFPANGYNQFDALDSNGITFEVKTEGIHSWKNVECLLYFSMEKSLLWTYPYDTIPCNGKYHFPGPLFIGDPAYLSDTSFAFFWGVVAHVPETNYAFNIDTSLVQTFYTALTQTETAELIIPIWYRSLSTGRSPSGKLILQNENGDTLAMQKISENPSTLSFKKLKAGKNFHLTISDSLLTEYSSFETQFDLPKATYNVLDTIVLRDTVPPQFSPNKMTFAQGDSIRFSLFDAGSGIANNSVRILIDGEAIERTIRQDEVRFLPSCKNRCILSLSLRDYAGNLSAPILWTLQNKKDALTLAGPFNPEDL